MAFPIGRSEWRLRRDISTRQGWPCWGIVRSMSTPIRFGFEHSYAALPPGFFAQVVPTPVTGPALVAWNRELAQELGIDPDLPPADAAAIFSGNTLPADAVPISMAYAGHQFGGFVPRLGDGR